MTGDKSFRVLEWLYAAENEAGGIAAWKDTTGKYHKSYPEVTGYLIPTLFDWKMDTLAVRCADWLLTIQNEDGSFSGMDGLRHTFDTAAVMEGLQRAFFETHSVDYLRAATKARNYLKGQVRPDGSLRRFPEMDDTAIYTLRASALLGSDAGREYWMGIDWFQGNFRRVHYIAYALDGLWRMGEPEFVIAFLHGSEKVILPSGLMPFWVGECWTNGGDSDICATAQMAILYQRAGLDPERLVRGVEAQITPSGGVPQSTNDKREISWGAKFALDMWKECGHA